MLSRLVLQGNCLFVQFFNYIFSKLKRFAITFYNRNLTICYDMVQNHHQKRLDEQMVCRVSLACKTVSTHKRLAPIA